MNCICKHTSYIPTFIHAIVWSWLVCIYNFTVYTYLYCKCTAKVIVAITWVLWWDYMQMKQTKALPRMAKGCWIGNTWIEATDSVRFTLNFSIVGHFFKQSHCCCFLWILQRSQESLAFSILESILMVVFGAEQALCRDVSKWSWSAYVTIVIQCTYKSEMWYVCMCESFYSFFFLAIYLWIYSSFPPFISKFVYMLLADVWYHCWLIGGLMHPKTSPCMAPKTSSRQTGGGFLMYFWIFPYAPINPFCK